MHHMANITDLVPGGVLTEQQMRFVSEYTIDLNATQAAIRAGYAEDSAAVTGCRLLRNPNISRAIKAYREQIADECHITQGDIIRKLVEAAEKASEATPVLEWDAEEKRMMPSGVYQFDGKTVTRCWELIGKMLGFIDNKAVGDGGVSGLNIMFISHLTQLEAKKQGITIDQLKKQISENVSRETIDAPREAEGPQHAGA